MEFAAFFKLWAKEGQQIGTMKKGMKLARVEGGAVKPGNKDRLEDRHDTVAVK